MSVNCSNLRIVRDLIPSLGKGTFYPFIFSNKHQSSHRITQSSVPLFLFLPSSFPIPLCAFVRALCTYIYSFSFFHSQFLTPLFNPTSTTSKCKLLPNHGVGSANPPENEIVISIKCTSTLIESVIVYTTGQYSLLIIIYRARRCNLFFTNHVVHIATNLPIVLLKIHEQREN